MTSREELLMAGLEQLLAAVHADDPKREILVRIGDAIREAKALTDPAQGSLIPAGKQARSKGVDRETAWFGVFPSHHDPMHFDYRTVYALPSTGLPAPAPHAEVRDLVQKVSDAIARTMFAPHELPLSGDLAEKYRMTARAAIAAVLQEPEAPVKKQEWLFNDADAVAKRAAEDWPDAPGGPL